jgi:cobalt/nickel transport system permease protein
MARRGFLEKTAAQVTVALKETLVYEELATQPGLLQGLDPRAKVVALVLLILAVAMSTQLEALVGLYLLTLLLAWFSRMPLLPFVRRVWVFMPFFTAAIALPALFLTPGDPWITLLTRPFTLVITVQGARTALTLILRVAASVSLAILVVATTRWPALLKALRSLRLPQTLVLILSMTRRYIFLLLQKVEDMLLARRSRMLGRLPSAEGRRMAAGMAGALVARSYQMSQEVHLAMEARGFRGEVRLADEFRWRVRDTLALLATLLLGGLAVWIGHW